MVFTSIAKILSEVNDRTSEFLECAKLTWDIWRTENPASHRSGHQKSGDNQAALVAYLQCFTELYPLLTNWLLLEQVQSILEQLQTCATGSTPTSYSGDVDKLTPLQKHIVNCIRMIRPGQPGTGSALVNVMSYFIVLPYEQKSTSPNRNGPTFVALSLESMDLLINHAIKEYNVDEIYTSGAIILAIRALSRAISLKFKWHLEGKDNVPWKRATTTAVDLLKATNLSLKQAQMEDMDRISLWKDILSACHGIISVDPEISPQILRNKSNEEFDIEAFRDIYDLIVPDLGSPSLSDQLRRSFAESLFHNSIVHEPHPDDLPYQGEELLECLQSEHIGRTKDLPPAPRAKLSYVLLERLFDLVTLYDGSVERVKLSQAAAPYLILRVGITLKAYISDQPLRGRMPQPASQRTELLCILQKLIELKLEPKAIPDAPGVVSKHRKHLYRIYGLVGKALVVARNDYELQGALSQIIEAVTREFGID